MKTDILSIGDRRELFVDDVLIESTRGDAALQLHQPERRDVVLRTANAWGGGRGGYASVFRDHDRVRMYYYTRTGHGYVLCYAESEDGIDWRKPELGLCAHEGAVTNNIVADAARLAAVKGCPAHTAVFKDANPACPAHERYKLVCLGRKPVRGLYLFGAAEGRRFDLLSPEPVVTKGEFDSQNVVFWDSVRNVYREYHRARNLHGRDIMTAASPDARRFPQPQWLHYAGAPPDELYTNAVQPYYRAPHILMGFPMRYADRQWSMPTAVELPDAAERLDRARQKRRYGTAVTDTVFMTSRDGLRFHRWPDAFVRPGPNRHGTWVYGAGKTIWGMLETASPLPGAPPEISFYVTEGSWHDEETAFRRYALRLDGFVSVQASAAGGELITRPVVFDGGRLTLNLATSAAGSVRVELQDAEGSAIPGYALEDCPDLFGDSPDFTVRWVGRGGDLRGLAGRPVRLRFRLREADVYSFRFAPWQPEPEQADLTGLGVLPARIPGRAPFTVASVDLSAFEIGPVPAADALAPLRLPTENAFAAAIAESDGTRHLEIRRVGKHHPHIQLTAQDAADSLNGVLEITMRLRLPTRGRGAVTLDAFDHTYEPEEFSRRAFGLMFAPDGVRVCGRDGTGPVPGIQPRRDAWLDVDIRADLRAARFDLTVDGRTATGMPFAGDDIHRVRTIAIGTTPGTGAWCVTRLALRVIAEA